jgi:hypothetical protein
MFWPFSAIITQVVNKKKYNNGCLFNIDIKMVKGKDKVQPRTGHKGREGE